MELNVMKMLIIVIAILIAALLFIEAKLVRLRQKEKYDKNEEVKFKKIISNLLVCIFISMGIFSIISFQYW